MGDVNEDIEQQTSYDCSHYKRKCLLVAPCCKKPYTCRICHDEAENHKLDRSKVSFLICSQCGVEQKVDRNCRSCGILFGKYFCLKCCLFDDNTDKGQFHCDGCGICRIGGANNFFHCERCNMCLTLSIKETHKCIENISKGHCPVCLDDIHTSRKSVHIPECGHLLHRECLTRMLNHRHASCPVCNKSLVDLSDYWKALDEEIQNTEMPEPYRNFRVNILCRDCHAKSKILFHVIGLKCQSCGSYNTTRDGGDDDTAPVFDELGNVRELTLDTSDSDNSWELLSDEVTTDEADENNTDLDDPDVASSNQEHVETGNSNDMSEQPTVNMEPQINSENNSNNATDNHEIANHETDNSEPQFGLE